MSTNQEDEIGLLGRWTIGEPLVMRFLDDGSSAGAWSKKCQAEFIAEVKAFAAKWRLALKDWGPNDGMLQVMLFEGPEGELEQRLRDIEDCIAAFDGATLPANGRAALERVVKRVQER